MDPRSRRVVRLLAGEATAMGAGRHGVYEMIERNETLDEGATMLGYEPVSCQHGLGRSWLCNGLHTEIDAVELAAEPGPWLPWQISYFAPRP